MKLYTDATRCRYGHLVAFCNQEMTVFKHWHIPVSDINEAEIEAVRKTKAEYPNANIYTDSKYASEKEDVTWIPRDQNVCDLYLQMIKEQQ